MAFTKPAQTGKVLKAGGNVKMQDQMAHASVPHGSFHENVSPFARPIEPGGGAPAGKKPNPFAKGKK